MATRRKYYEDDMYYEPRNGGGAVWVMALAMVGAAIAFGVWLWPEIAHTPGLPEQTKKGAVGNQAPPTTRGSFGGIITVATPMPGVAQNEATAQAEYQQAVQGMEQPQAAPLPLNSAGQPVISQEQQAQMQQSLQLAEQEGAAAADQQLAAQRATVNAEQLSRPPDVSYQDAVNLLHRDPCSVPRANPATCSQGLYKPTPVN